MTAMQKYEAPQTGLTFGQTAMRPGDFIPPRVKVVQAMSKEAQKAGKEPAVAEVGDFYNVLTGEVYGDTLRFIPLTTFMNRIFISRPERRDAIEAVLLRELSEGDGLKCRSLDMVIGVGDPGGECMACPLSQWRGAEPPICSETYNVAAMTEVGDLIIIGFSKSSAKVGKKLMSILRMSHQKPWTRVLVATTRMETNARGTFAVPDVRVTGDQPDDTLLRIAQDWIEELTGRVIDVTPEDEEEVSAEAPF